MAPERDELEGSAHRPSEALDGALTRRGLVRLLGTGATGIALTGFGWRGALGQDDPTPEADPVPDPEPEEGASPEAAGGDLTIYSGRSENLVGPILERYEEAAGVEVAVRYASTGELAQTLLDEGDETDAALFFAQDAGALGLLAGEGRLQPLPDELLERVDPRFRSPDGLWVGVSGRARVLVYNTDELQPGDLPASVLELTDEQWRGRVGWAPENASFQSFVTALRSLEGEDAARDWLDQMQANQTVDFGDSNAAIVQAVGTGEIAVGLTNHYYLYAAKEEEGDDFPIANHFFAAGDPGSLVNVAGVGLLAEGEDAEQALALVDYLLGKEAQLYFAEETSEYPLVAGVPTAEGLTPLAEVGGPEIDLSDLADLRGTVDLLTEVGVL